LARLWIIAACVAALLATVAPVKSADADWYEPRDKVPYGAASLYQTDPARLTKSITYQLWSAGLGGTTLDLFPPAPTPTDGWFQPGPPILVRGLNPYSVEYSYIQAHMDIYPYASLRPCQTTEFQREGPMPDLVEVALHEAAHYTSYRLGLEPSAYRAVKQKIDAYNRGLASHPEYQTFVSYNNVREDIADASAILYIYSNFANVAVNDTEARAKADMRVAEYFDWGHETSASIMAARAAFLRAPKHGLTIIETTRWAASLVTSLPPATIDARLQAARQVGDPALGGKAFEARLDGAYNRFRAARNRFCGAG
jgi:hypothetical protein